MKTLALVIALSFFASGCYVTSEELARVQREWSEAVKSGDEQGKSSALISLEEMKRRQEAFEELLRTVTAGTPGVLTSMGTPQGVAGAITSVVSALAAYAAARRKATEIASQQRELVKMEINAERDRKYVDAAKSVKVEPGQAT